jgi:hypothetical protein
MGYDPINDLGGNDAIGRNSALDPSFKCGESVECIGRTGTSSTMRHARDHEEPDGCVCIFGTISEEPLYTLVVIDGPERGNIRIAIAMVHYNFAATLSNLHRIKKRGHAQGELIYMAIASGQTKHTSQSANVAPLRNSPLPRRCSSWMTPALSASQRRIRPRTRADVLRAFVRV